MLKAKLVKRKKYSELFESKFVPLNIKDYVEKNMKGYLHVKTYLCNVEIEVIYALFKESEIRNLRKVEKKIKKGSAYF